MRRLAVLGSPIAHSRSPLIHRAAYRVLGLEWQYDRIECDEQGLAPLLDSVDETWLGFSCTMPLKETARKLASQVEPVAAESGVVNTLVRDGSGWIGANTDVGGLLMALNDHRLDVSRTLVLGAGATAVSAVLAAKQGGAEHVEVTARRPEAAQAIAERYGAVAGKLGEAPSAAPTVVVSTLPGPAGAALELPSTVTNAPLFDVAYEPWPSPLSECWKARGSQTYSGLDMLIFQALLQIRLFVNGAPDAPLSDESAVIEAMRQAASSSMEE